MRRTIIILALVVFAAAQFKTVERINPPIESDLPAAPHVKSFLKRACYDCHSYETEWRWYSYVAPVSWVVARHVYNGRDVLNFSKWDSYSRGAKGRHLSDSILSMQDGTMPTWDYLIAHPSAKLSPEEVESFKEWANDYLNGSGNSAE